jgi:hypothetical protein
MNGFAQQPKSGVPLTGASTQGTLTVSVTVVTSVGLVIGSDGEPRIVVANSVDPKDNVSSLYVSSLYQVNARASDGGTVPSPSHQTRESSKQSSRAPVQDGTSWEWEHLF